jgi:uncharacterized protein involved in exopolysaccharide biosynthesis
MSLEASSEERLGREMPASISESSSTGRLTLYDLILLATRKPWLGVFCVLGGVGIAAWVAFTSKPIYRAEAVVMLAQPTDQSESRLPDQIGGLAALAGLTFGGAGDRKAEALATLQSRVLTESFVQDNNLLPVLFASRWDPERNEWRANAKAPTLWDANKLISTSVRKVLEDRKTGLITVAVEWTDPKLAAEWTAELVERTNKLLQQSAYGRATRNIAYLRKQLEETNIVEVRQALNNLMESELKTSMLAQRSEDYAFKVLDRAVVPQEKVRPRRALLLALGLTGGIFAWVFALIGWGAIILLLEEHRRSGGRAADK